MSSVQVQNVHIHIPAWLLMLVSLVSVLFFGLLSALISALLVFSATRFLHDKLNHKVQSPLAWAVVLSGFIFIGSVGLSGLALMALFDSEVGFSALMIKATEALSLVKSVVPKGLSSLVPSSADDFIVLLQEWLRSNSNVLPSIAKKTITVLFHIIVGGIIGSMSAIAVLSRRDRSHDVDWGGYWGKALGHLSVLQQTFERVVFAQINIALVNAVFTGLFLYFGMPMLGFELPFVKTLIVVTFFLGLLPIVGNLLSNTIIFLVGLSVSPVAAVVALVFLVVIHKLEYFLNAWIIGSKTDVRSYEVLAAMVVFEAIFGLSGLISAPIFYAYLKKEIMLHPK